MKVLFNTRTLFLRGMLLTAVLSAVVLGCSDDDDNTTPEEESGVAVKLGTNAILGSYLTDGDGNTLYYFATDVAGTNTCTGGCAAAWPVYNAADLKKEQVGEGLNFDDFGTVTTNSVVQTTYKGWPLYYYAPGGVREAANQTTGDGVGGIWFVAKPNYTIQLAKSQLIGADNKHYKGDYTEGDEAVTYFTDAHGRTLYTFKPDKKNTNTYTNQDAAHNAIWPIFEATPDQVPSALDKTLFGSIDVFGKKQLTYKGWPIYYFGSDTQRGQNKGVSVPAPGVWPVVVKDAAAAPEAKKAITLGTSETLGSYLQDGDGNTLYYFATDVAGANTCTGGCTALWPVYNAAGLTENQLGDGLTFGDFATVTTNGVTQTTYKGWPLYYYSPGGVREAAGETKGEGVGGVWFVAKPDYTIQLAKGQLIGADNKHYKGDYTEGDAAVTYFTDAHGRTLYTFTNDSKDTNTFTSEGGAQNAVWPIFEATPDQIPSTLDKTQFGSIDVFGKKQLTYKGWPVYYYGPDAQRGQTKGVSVPNPGVWPVVVKDVVAAPED